VQAGRAGQQLNISALSNETGVEIKTVQAWLSILQSSYIIYLLPPYHKNFNKRVVKTPKLYFVDTGIACSLLGIREKKELVNSHFRAALFENYIIMELLKQKQNAGSAAGFYYWKENNGLEIDLLIDNGTILIAHEIKASATFNESLLKGIYQWKKLTGTDEGVLLYNGQIEIKLKNQPAVMNWTNYQLKTF
jgi:predicted AAA+ superfamily ATPase